MIPCTYRIAVERAGRWLDDTRRLRGLALHDHLPSPRVRAPFNPDRSRVQEAGGIRSCVSPFSYVGSRAQRALGSVDLLAAARASPRPQSGPRLLHRPRLLDSARL